MLAARPSLDWTLAKLTGTWVDGDKPIACPLPGHDDGTPSFNLWAPDDAGIPQRFGCFGCARGGDVVELIQELEGLDQEGALRRAGELAAEEAQDETPRERRIPEKKEGADLNELVRSLEEAMDVRRLEKFQKYMTTKALDGEQLEGYAMSSWGWTVGDNGAVAVPHRDREGQVTAVKYRTPDKKWAEDGSRYPALYGAWRDRARKRVVLCEGESDTLWAAWSLRAEDVDVLGLPSGAGQGVPDSWIQELAGRELVMVFDADDAGMTAAAKWSGIRPDALLARLPEGEDLLSCGIPVKEILESASVPMRPRGVVDVRADAFVKISGGDALTNFGLRPLRELTTEDGPAWEVEITGRPGTELLKRTDLRTGLAITNWANARGRAWFGKGTDHQEVYDWLKAASAYLPLERTTTRAGRYGRSFVGPDFCIGPDRIRYIPPARGDVNLHRKLAIEDGTIDMKAIAALERLNDPAVMSTIIGWLVATLIRGKRPPSPPLFVAGEAGAGKTVLLSTVLSSFGFNTEMALSTTTAYGVDSMVNSCVGFPVWFDEFRHGAKEESITRLRQLARDAYYGQPSIKGGMTQNATELTEVWTWAGIVISGEMSSNETSHRDRMIMLRLDPTGKEYEPKAFEFLRDHPEATVGLGHALLTFLASRPQALFQVQAKGGDDLPARFRDALGFVNAGWDAWREFRWAQGLRDEPAAPNFDQLIEERQEVEDPYLEAIHSAIGALTREGQPVVLEKDGAVLLVPQEILKRAGEYGIVTPSRRAQDLRDWLRSRYEVVDDNTLGRRGIKVIGMKL
jgi:hypothetical protein